MEQEEKKKFSLKDLLEVGGGSRREKLEAAGEAVQSESVLGRDAKIGEILLATVPALAGLAVGGSGGGAIGAKAGADVLGGLLSEEQTQAGEARKSKAELAKEDRQFKRDVELQKMKDKSAKELKAMETEKEKVPTPQQRLAAGFAARVKQSEDVFSGLQSKGKSGAGFLERAERMLPSAFQGETSKSRDQAERNFVNAILRRESGAAISAQEFANAESQYFPRAGDTPDVLEQKRQNRQIALAGLQAEAGQRALGDVQTQYQQLQAGATPIRGGQQQVPGIDTAHASDLETLSDSELDKILAQERMKKQRGGR